MKNFSIINSLKKLNLSIHLSDKSSCLQEISPPETGHFFSGQLLPISQNQALYSILGTTYGGDERKTFGLPDFRGRVPISQGLENGLKPRRIG